MKEQEQCLKQLEGSDVILEQEVEPKQRASF